ncbi:MAG TPA: hypothetical protein VGH43_02705, partial [Jatrophihabitans sp.]
MTTAHRAPAGAIRVDTPDGAARFLTGRLEEDPAYDTREGQAIRTLLAERETSREPVPFDAALSPCLTDLLRKSLTHDRVSPCRKAM